MHSIFHAGGANKMIARIAHANFCHAHKLLDHTHQIASKEGFLRRSIHTEVVSALDAAVLCII